MSILPQIPLLEDLSRLDERLRIVEEDLHKQKGALATLEGDIAMLEKRLLGDRESITGMEKTRNELVVEMRQMSQQIERSREKLARSRNERETVAAQREMEELRKLVRDRDDEAGKIETLLERARTSIDDTEKKLAELRAEREGSAEGAAKTLHDREAERVQLASDREAAAKALTPVLLRRYETIRQRRPRAIAQTTNGTCNGCHIQVPPMMFQQMLAREQFEQCPQCRRILYYVPPGEASTGAQADAASSDAQGP